MPPKLAVVHKDRTPVLIEVVRELGEREYQAYQTSSQRLLEYATEQQVANAVRDAYQEYKDGVDEYYAQFVDRRPMNTLEVQRRLNTLASNFLRAFRAFLDHSKKHLSDRYGKDSEQVRAFEEATHREYDANFSYRLLDQVRNYTQHAGDAVHRIDAGMGPAADNEEDTEYTFTPQIDRDKLLAYQKLKPSVRKEVEGLPAYIALTPHFDELMKSFLPIRTEIIVGQVFEIQEHARRVRRFAEGTNGYGGTPLILHWAPPEGTKVGEEVALNMSHEAIPLEIVAFILKER